MRPGNDYAPKRSQKELLNCINETSFVCNDYQLYLDTHPDDGNIRKRFCECLEKRTQLLEEYASLYSPLTIDVSCSEESSHWSWVCDPFPWEGGIC